MGVPKFFRYISERYPCLSESIGEGQIPTFDNLYLDMNGIIHVCSHPDNDPLFRISEERIFSGIFRYIEYLFQLIRPRKVMFMAVDGVAPRAKCNQQRGRRFRTADEATRAEADARQKGLAIPETPRFDTNCITPGTEFMARLHERLKYFVVKQISTNELWRSCTVILSGHETPGEGEAKIMEYIRYCRSQSGYDPNTRHCLYGLDADLIMLGLCTHDPHFSLLREEVKFGRNIKRGNVNNPEETRFFLLHLSLMREYLELEFQELQTTLVRFKFDIEKIIDDWVLMGFLVGNDFIPHLPNFHIVNGALPDLYRTYIEVLPTLDGYINESGILNLKRFELFVEKLAAIDEHNFQNLKDDLLYMESKCSGKKSRRNQLKNNTIEVCEDFDLNLDKFIENMQNGSGDEALEVEPEQGPESSTIPDTLETYKANYYRQKLEFDTVDETILRNQSECYVRAIQWNLHYYYNGLCSWSWYYPHHYAPFVSDIHKISDLQLDFDLAAPFKPFEQLLAVLPQGSKDLLPKCYQDLMTDAASPIIDYYPSIIKTDLNGKRQEWEAVVLLPFIDENILLQTMATKNKFLNAEEVNRNQHKPMLIYTHTTIKQPVYKGVQPFPDIGNCHTISKRISRDDIQVSRHKLIKGAYPGAKFDLFYPGFPTMKHLSYKGTLKQAKVKVFEHPSRNENMLLSIVRNPKTNELPLELLGQHVHIKWPYLVEAKVVAIMDAKGRYSLPMGETTTTNYTFEEASNKDTFSAIVTDVSEKAIQTQGIDFGPITVLLHTKLVLGKRPLFMANGKISFKRHYCTTDTIQPYQSIVENLSVYTGDTTEKQNLFVSDIFTNGSTCFVVKYPYYGARVSVLNCLQDTIRVSLEVCKEPDFSALIQTERFFYSNYLTATKCASRLGIAPQVFTRLTTSIYGYMYSTEDGVDIFDMPLNENCEDYRKRTIKFGLELRFIRRGIETPGYSKRLHQNLWLYSEKTMDLIYEYVTKFPEIIQFLSDTNRQSDDDLNVAQFLFTKPERLLEYETWWKSLPIHNLERRSCNSRVLDMGFMRQIDQIVQENGKNQGQITINLKPQQLFKPEYHNGQFPVDPSIETQLFDRIVNISLTNGYPLGVKGTVIGIHKTPNDFEQYEVLFDDKVYMIKTPNADNTNTLRTYRISQFSVLNLTHGTRLMEQQTGRPGALLSLAKANQITNNFRKNAPTPPNNSAFAAYGPSTQNNIVHNNNNNSNNFVPHFALSNTTDITTESLRKMLNIHSPEKKPITTQTFINNAVKHQIPPVKPNKIFVPLQVMTRPKPSASCSVPNEPSMQLVSSVCHPIENMIKHPPRPPTNEKKKSRIAAVFPKPS